MVSTLLDPTGRVRVHLELLEDNRINRMWLVESLTGNIVPPDTVYVSSDKDGCPAARCPDGNGMGGFLLLLGEGYWIESRTFRFRLKPLQGFIVCKMNE